MYFSISITSIFKLFGNIDKAVTVIFSTSTLLIFSPLCKLPLFHLINEEAIWQNFCALVFVIAASWGGTDLY